MPEQEGLYYPDGSFKSKSDLIVENFSKPIIEYDVPNRLVCSDWFEEANRRQDVKAEVTDVYNYAKIEIERDRPAFIGITSDWQIGQRVNYKLLQRDVDIMAHHPLVVGNLFVGDLTDSANFNPAQDEEVLSFEEQRSMMLSILDEIGKDRIMALWKGNHDHKWESKHGTSKYTGLSDKYECPVFYGNSFIELVINGNEPYRMVGSHQLRGSSIYNNAHPIVRAHREIQNLDIAFCGHTHRKGLIKQPTRSFAGANMIGGVVCGTYQISSEYSKDSGWGDMYDPEQGMWFMKLDHETKSVQYLTTEEMLKEASLYM